jgi:hypothetical protein
MQLTWFCLLFASAITACMVDARADHENAAQAPPTKDALVTPEKSPYQAWKSGDEKFWDGFLADKFVGYGSSGKLDKASAAQEFRGLGCQINSYDLSFNVGSIQVAVLIDWPFQSMWQLQFGIACL